VLRIVNLQRNEKSLIISEVDNIDFENGDLLNSKKVEELKVVYNEPLSVFNPKLNRVEKIMVNNIKKHHWLIRDSKMYKILGSL
jgi:hypothetical protein